MTKVTEIRDILFNVTLADGSTLSLLPAESKSIKTELVSDSLLEGVRRGCVTIEETDKKNSSNKKNGGAVNNE